jgi:hypothetical protein
MTIRRTLKTHVDIVHCAAEKRKTFNDDNWTGGESVVAVRERSGTVTDLDAERIEQRR